MPRSTLLAALVTLVACCGDTSSPASRLPASDEIDGWTLVGAPAVIASDTALYNQIDGGAPKYLDRGWKSGAYATYQRGASSLQVAVHDMGTSDNAESIFQLDLPVSRVQIDNLANTAVDTTLPTAYFAEAFAGQYYIEISVDDRSDAALTDLERFVRATMSR
jgi:hypothetical protein